MIKRTCKARARIQSKSGLCNKRRRSEACNYKRRHSERSEAQ